MKQLSFWAQQHRSAARLLIVLSYFLFNAAGFVLGLLLDYAIPYWVSYLLLLPFLTAVVLYPSKNEKYRYDNFYRARKTADLVLVTSTFLLIVCSCSRFPDAITPVATDAAFASMHAPVVEPPGKKKWTIQLVKRGFVAKHWKQIKEHVHEIRTALRQKSNAGKAALIILTLIVALGLLLLVAGISCELSCSGAEGLAFTVALLGTGLVVFLTVLVIRRIKRGPKQPEPQQPPNDAGT